MRSTPFRVLFLCTGNSARSILAEAILNRLAGKRFLAFSAGSQPKGAVHPEAIALLTRLGYETAALHSKSWEEFGLETGDAGMDFVFTVCDSAAAEVCPIWPGQPITAHWGVPDPAAVTGSVAASALAFCEAYRQLRVRIEAFVALPDLGMERLALKARLREIGRMPQPAFAQDD